MSYQHIKPKVYSIRTPRGDTQQQTKLLKPLVSADALQSNTVKTPKTNKWTPLDILDANHRANSIKSQKSQGNTFNIQSAFGTSHPVGTTPLDNVIIEKHPREANIPDNQILSKETDASHTKIEDTLFLSQTKCDDLAEYNKSLGAMLAAANRRIAQMEKSQSNVNIQKNTVKTKIERIIELKGGIRTIRTDTIAFVERLLLDIKVLQQTNLLKDVKDTNKKIRLELKQFVTSISNDILKVDGGDEDDIKIGDLGDYHSNFLNELEKDEDVPINKEEMLTASQESNIRKHTETIFNLKMELDDKDLELQKCRSRIIYLEEEAKNTEPGYNQTLQEKDNKIKSLQESESSIQAQLDKQKDSHKHKIEKLDQIINNLKNQIDNFRGSIKINENEKNDLIKQLQLEKGDLQTDKTESDKLINQYNKEINNLKEKLSKLEAELKILENKNIDLEKSLIEQTESLKNAEGREVSMVKQQTIKNEMGDRVTSLKKNIEDLEHANRQLKTDNQGALLGNTNKDKEISVLRKNLVKAEEELKVLKQKQEKATLDEKSKSKRALEELASKTKAYDEHMKKCSGTNKNVDQNLEKCEKELQDCKTKLIGEVQKVSDQQKNIESLQQRNKDLNNELSKLNFDYDVMVDKFEAKLRIKCGETDKQVQDLGEESHKRKDSEGLIEAKLTELNNQETEMNKQKELLEESQRIMFNELSTIKDKNQKLEEELNNMADIWDEDKKVWESSKNNQLASNKTLSEKNQELAETILDLTEKKDIMLNIDLENLKKDYESRLKDQEHDYENQLEDNRSILEEKENLLNAHQNTQNETEENFNNYKTKCKKSMDEAESNINTQEVKLKLKTGINEQLEASINEMEESYKEMSKRFNEKVEQLEQQLIDKIKAHAGQKADSGQNEQENEKLIRQLKNEKEAMKRKQFELENDLSETDAMQKQSANKINQLKGIISCDELEIKELKDNLATFEKKYLQLASKSKNTEEIEDELDLLKNRSCDTKQQTLELQNKIKRLEARIESLLKDLSNIQHELYQERKDSEETKKNLADLEGVYLIKIKQLNNELDQYRDKIIKEASNEEFLTKEIEFLKNKNYELESIANNLNKEFKNRLEIFESAEKPIPIIKEANSDTKDIKVRYLTDELNYLRNQLESVTNEFEDFQKEIKKTHVKEHECFAEHGPDAETRLRKELQKNLMQDLDLKRLIKKLEKQLQKYKSSCICRCNSDRKRDWTKNKCNNQPKSFRAYE